MTDGPYADIRRRLAEATGPDKDIDVAIARALFEVVDRSNITGWREDYFILLPETIAGPYEKRVPEWTASLDAAVALVEEKLPGWCILMAYNSKTKRGRADIHSEPLGTPGIWTKGGGGTTLPLAVVTALFAALEAAHD